MTTELSTVIYKVNWKYILNNYLDRRLWKKSWVVYNYNDVIIKMRLRSIDILDNEIVLILTPNHYSWIYSSIYIPLSSDHFNEEVFYNKLFNSISTLVQRVETEKITKTESYKMAYRLDEQACESFYDKTEEWLDDKDIHIEEVREAYIEKCLEDFDKDRHKKMVLEELRYTFLAPNYLMLATMFKRDGDYEFHLKYANDIDEVTKEIQEAFDNFDIQDIEDEIDEVLESLGD